MRDRGEPLNMRTEKADEHLRLCLAQLREVCGDMGDRAVVLADLDPRAGLLRSRGIPIGRERRSQFGRTAISWQLCERRCVANFETVQALPRERAYRLISASSPQVAEGLDRDVVISVRK